MELIFKISISLFFIKFKKNRFTETAQILNWKLDYQLKPKIMKNFLLLLGLVIFFGSANAQKLSIEDIVDKVRQVDLFIKYGKFKDTVETALTVLANNEKITVEEVEKLNLAYEEMRLKYNRFLESIKADLSKWSQIKAMTKNPDAFAQKYMDAYEDVLNYYRKTYSKTFNDIEKEVKRRNGEFATKAIGLGTILLLIDEARPLIQSIVKWFKERRDDKDEAKNNILMIINERLFNKLEMKAWEKLVIKKNNEKPVEPSGLKKKNEAYIEHPDLTLIDDEQFKGSLYFNWCTEGCNDLANSNTEKIAFKATPKLVKSKTVTVGKFDDTTDKKVQKTLRYSSDKTYGDGYMQLKLNTEAAAYIFAYNTSKEKKIEPIFPFPSDYLRDLGFTDQQIGSKTKSITVSPFFSSSKDGSRVIPAPAHKNGTEVPLFMNVKNDAEEEYIVVLLSKKQLPEDFYAEVEEADGSNLETKLYNVLGDQLLSSDNSLAKFTNNGNVLSFDASQLKDGLVMGLIFVIRH
jgi:hypothetical protein